jgi:hypothetical protein
MDGVATTNGSSSHDALTPEVTTSVSTAFDPEVFRSYLLALLPPVIGANPVDLESLFDDEFNARVVRFASEIGGVIYVIKVKEDSDSGT